MTSVKRVTTEIMGGIEAESADLKLLAEFLFLACEPLEFRFGGPACELPEVIFHEGGDVGGRLCRLDSGTPVKIIIDADRNVFH